MHTFRIKGYDLFFADPGCYDKVVCQICGTTCHVQRNYMCASSFMQAMRRQKSPHDRFTCPRSVERWHYEALELANAIDVKYDSPERGKWEQSLQRPVEENANQDAS